MTPTPEPPAPTPSATTDTTPRAGCASEAEAPTYTLEEVVKIGYALFGLGWDAALREPHPNAPSRDQHARTAISTLLAGNTTGGDHA